VTPLAGLPSRVTVYEVGPRDGLQNERTVVPVDIKAEFVRRLLAAGLRAVETTSFVSPKWVPQLADADPAIGARTAAHAATDTRPNSSCAPGTGSRDSSALACERCPGSRMGQR